MDSGNNRLAKFNELVPSSLPFVEGKLEGHKERKNYSIVGPGVAEDSSQFVKIAMPHSFNLGAGYRLSEDWSLCLDYRYFLTAAGDEYDRIKSHILALSATYDL